MSDIEETPLAHGKPETSADLTKARKPKGASPKFLVIAILLGVVAFFGILLALYGSELMNLNSQDPIAPSIPAPNGEPAAPIQQGNL